MPYQSPESHDLIDGNLSCLVLRLLNVSANMLSASEQLDSATLYFFHQMRKSYIGDNAQRASKLYNHLSEDFGINDQQQACVRAGACHMHTHLL